MYECLESKQYDDKDANSFRKRTRKDEVHLPQTMKNSCAMKLLQKFYNALRGCTIRMSRATNPCQTRGSCTDGDGSGVVETISILYPLSFRRVHKEVDSGWGFRDIRPKKDIYIYAAVQVPNELSWCFSFSTY